MSTLKDLTYTDLNQLDEVFKYDLKAKLDFKNYSVCGSLLKIHDQGDRLMQLGDQENAYGFLMRFAEGAMLLFKSELYKKDKTYVDAMITKEKFEKTLQKLESLKKSLKLRYEKASSQKNSTENETKTDKAETKIKTLTAANVFKTQTPAKKKQISSPELYEILTKSQSKVLIIDTRSKTEFVDSQMNLSILLSSDKKRQKQISYINIPVEFVTGVSWHIYEALKANNAETASIFNTRKAYDYVVLLDNSSSLNTLTQESKLLTLKRALYEFEYENERLQHEPVILDGGFSQWLAYYPGYSTSSVASNLTHLKLETSQQEVSSIKKALNFDYPEIDVKPKPSSPVVLSVNKVQTDFDTNSQLPTDTSKNKTMTEADSGVKFLSKNITPVSVPSINRSNKPKNVMNINGPDSRPNGTQDDEANTEKIYNRVEDEISDRSINKQQSPPIIPQNILPKHQNKGEPQDSSAPDQIQISQKRDAQSNSNTLKINITKPSSVKLPSLSSNSQLDKTAIYNSVYAPPSRSNRPVQTPYMKDGTSKVLDNQTGLFSYVPTSALAAQIPPKQPMSQMIADSKPEPPKQPEFKPKPSARPTNKLGSNLKRTLSSPNIAKLDDELIDDPVDGFRGMDDKKPTSQAFLKKPETKIAPKPSNSLPNNSNVANIKVVAQPSTPNVNRNNKPLPEHVFRSRIEDLNPVYGNAHQGLVGIRNLGNTCFMNSILQCLISTKRLVSYFLNEQYKVDLNRSNDLGFRGEIAEEFAVITQAIWGGYCRTISPKRFRDLIGQFNSLFVSNDQQDAQELLLFLLDGLHEDLNRVINRPKIVSKEDEDENLSDSEAAKLAWSIHLSVNNSIIVDIFQGQFKSTVTCMACQKKSVKFDAFMYLTLPLPSNKCHLYQCIDLFLEPEKMYGESKWMCPRCKQYREALKKIDIWRLPRVLIIHLKRFKYQGIWRDKINTLVQFPVEDLNMDRYVMDDKYNAKTDYQLYAVSNHSGTLDGGHYTASCRHFNSNRWFKFDDSEVKETGSSSLISSTGYILFYSSK